MPSQLNLFKGKRQRGETPPPAAEFALHCMLADLLKRWCNPNWRYTHIPLGEDRNIITATRLKRMGVMRGWPDFIFVGRTGPGRGKVFFLELKRKGSGLSVEQAEIAAHLIESGCGYLCTDDFDEALSVLREMGIVRAAIGV